MMKKKLNKETITSRAGIESDQQHGSVVPPLYLSTNFVFDELGKEQAYEYTRQGNPTRDHLTNALTELESGIGGEVTSSGMAAVTLIANTLKLNSKVILPHDCYGGTIRLFTSLKEKGVLDVYFTDQSDLVALENTFKEINPDLVWIETPSNPLLQVVDIKQIAQKAKLHHSLVVVDNTFLSPALQNPLLLGADIVMHSSTKYINGHSDIVGGVVITNNEEILADLKFWANNLGITGAPFDSYLALRGLRTLSIRMEKHEKNAAAIVELLSNSDKIKTVYYPGLSNHPSHAIAKKQQKGFGGMLSFEIKGGVESAKKFVHELEILSFAESLGGFESLTAHPYTMSHAQLTHEEKAKIGISEDLIRISTGLENTDDLIDAISTGLKKL
jgi:cystathionine gamma-synthase